MVSTNILIIITSIVSIIINYISENTCLTSIHNLLFLIWILLFNIIYLVTFIILSYIRFFHDNSLSKNHILYYSIFLPLSILNFIFEIIIFDICEDEDFYVAILMVQIYR